MHTVPGELRILAHLAAEGVEADDVTIALAKRASIAHRRLVLGC